MGGRHEPTTGAGQGRGAISRLLQQALLNRQNSAENTLARLYRSDYENLIRRATPVENELIGSYRNGTQVRDAQIGAIGEVNKSFDLAQAGLADRMRSYGLPQQNQANQQRRSQFARGLSEIEAINRTGRRIYNRDAELMTSGVQPQSALNQRLGG
jgi:hypothetical protein